MFPQLFLSFHLFLTLLHYTNAQSETSVQPITHYESLDKNDNNPWSTAVSMIGIICACICLERLYSSCRKVYRYTNTILYIHTY